jgi:hypothetical protein
VLTVLNICYEIRLNKNKKFTLVDVYWTLTSICSTSSLHAQRYEMSVNRLNQASNLS